MFLPFAEPEPWLQPDLATSYPAVWVSVRTDARLAEFGERGLVLSDRLVAAAKDEAAGHERRFASVHQLHRVVGGTTFAEGDLHPWVSRTRPAIRTELEDGDLPKAVIDGDRGGYRVGLTVTATGFDLTAELTARQRRRGRGARSSRRVIR